MEPTSNAERTANAGALPGFREEAFGAPRGEIAPPMAGVILCGLIGSTARNMLLVPAFPRPIRATVPSPSEPTT